MSVKVVPMRTSRVLRGSALSCFVSAVMAGSHPIEQRGLLEKCNDYGQNYKLTEDRNIVRHDPPPTVNLRFTACH